MNEIELESYINKDVQIYCTNGKKIEGFACLFIKALDNEPEIASITLETKNGLVEILLFEIQAIQITA